MLSNASPVCRQQVPNLPYIGLWTRLQGFRREDLTRELEARRVFRTAMMRSTLHLVTADDLSDLRPPLQPALDRALNAFFGRRTKGLDIGKLVGAAGLSSKRRCAPPVS